jgi:hypothetical protein
MDASPAVMGGSNALFEGFSTAIELVSATRGPPGAGGAGVVATVAAIAAGTCLDFGVLLDRRRRLSSTRTAGKINALVTFGMGGAGAGGGGGVRYHAKYTTETSATACSTTLMSYAQRLRR